MGMSSGSVILLHMSSVFSVCDEKKQRNFEDAPHGDAIFLKIFRTLHTRPRFVMKKQQNLKKERDFPQNFQNASHGSAIFQNFQEILLNIFRTLCRDLF